jgi:outer membrane protein OmpA-like peptidoglycan-associated protein
MKKDEIGMRSHWLLKGSCVALVAATAALATPARAQTQPPLALDRFTPAPAGDRMFGVQSPFVAGEHDLHVMLLGDYAHNPLVLKTTSDNTRVSSVVGSQLFLHLDANLALWNRLAINIDVPVALLQDGDSSTATGSALTAPSKAQFGDLRAGARLRLLGDYHDLFQLAVGGYVWFPTGGDGFVSDKKVRGLPQLILGGRADRFVWSFAAGPELRPTQSFAGVEQGTMLSWGGGIGLLLGEKRHFQIGPEFSAAVTLGDVNKHTSNAEILLDARYRVIDNLELGLGIGPGLTSGIGTPDLRGVLMIAYTPEQKKAIADRDKDGIADLVDACPDVFGVASDDPTKHGCPLAVAPSDRDKDGILDADDACPDVPGVASSDKAKNGCPLPKDRDHDGIIDDLDACPDVAGIADPDPKKNGCPPPNDRDKDGIADEKDACPDVPGVATQDPATNGCPPDTDGDGIRDDKDACIKEKGKPNADPTKNGCPTVRVTETEVFILEQVQFDTSKATIKKVSDPLLDNVAQVLKEHPELLKLEVQGHTDNKGSKVGNKTLSQSRADAVKKAMIKRGIDAKRLTSVGYGQDVPVATNDTDEGRTKNRRVQFKIIEKTAKPAKP